MNSIKNGAFSPRHFLVQLREIQTRLITDGFRRIAFTNPTNEYGKKKLITSKSGSTVSGGT